MRKIVVAWVVGAVLGSFFSGRALGQSQATVLGVRLEFLGGPCLELVLGKRLSDDVVLRAAVGGFPGVILRVTADVSFASPAKGVTYGGGIGYNRYYRGRATGRGLVELHGGLGYRWWRAPGSALDLTGGLVWIPLGLNPWYRQLFREKTRGRVPLPIVSYLSVEFDREL